MCTNHWKMSCTMKEIIKDMIKWQVRIRQVRDSWYFIHPPSLLQTPELINLKENSFVLAHNLGAWLIGPIVLGLLVAHHGGSVWWLEQTVHLTVAGKHKREEEIRTTQSLLRACHLWPKHSLKAPDPKASTISYSTKLEMVLVTKGCLPGI
jgi:hypothetical protein